MQNKKRLIVITGPTATGKTSRGVDLARALNGEIISADSRQIYRGMDLGTGKDLDEYGDVPYHLIDIADAGYRYNLYEYLRDFECAMSDIESRDRQPILVGGTGLYVETVLKGVKLPEVPENVKLRKELEQYDLAALTEMLSKMKHLHNKTDVDTVKRAIRAIEIETYYAEHPEAAQAMKGNANTYDDAVLIGIDIDREMRRQRISRRLRQRLDAGMVDEVKGLIESGVDPDNLIYYGLEYKYLTLYVCGKLTYDEMVSQLEIAIHQFAKRQMTWFRGMERRGFKIHWMPYDMDRTEFVDAVINLMKNED
jgi:tRNA dimethylallyltransferase